MSESIATSPASIHDLPVPQLQQIYSRAFNGGQFAKAFQVCCEAINRDPDTDHHKLAMSTIIRQIVVQNYNPSVKSAIEQCLQSNVVARQNFWQAWHGLVMTSDYMRPLTGLVKARKHEQFCQKLNAAKLSACLDDPFLSLGLRTLILIDADMEILMRNLRRWLLSRITDNPEQAPSLSFLCALGEHCFLRDYVFFTTEDEFEQVSALKEKVESGDACDEEIAMVSAYIPLHILSNAKEIEGKVTLKSLVTQQITNPLTEQALKKDIRTVQPIGRETSQAVREMYEENPYPRWSSITIFPNPDAATAGEYLVAGCGTCKAALQFAMKFPKINITAIDLSLSSMAYGMRRAQEFGIHNVTFAQCDILDLPELGQTFDAIDCSGVLHHMKDPMAGWRSLLSVLKPGGRMNIGLYSTRARRSIHAGWTYISEKGYQPSAEDIRQFRDDVFAMTDDHPVKPVCQRVDFYNLSQCRDLVFHVQESTYTPEEIQKMLDDLDLNFEGFWLGNPKLEAEFLRQFPDDPGMRDLSNWSKLEEQFPNMFNGMLQFICSRKEDSEVPNPTWDGILNGKLFTLTGQKAA